MKVTFNTPVRNLFTKAPVVNPDAAPPQDGAPALALTFQYAAAKALLSSYENESLTADQKAERYDLAERINDTDGEVEITEDEAQLVRVVVARLYGPLIVGQLTKAIKAARAAAAEVATDTGAGSPAESVQEYAVEGEDGDGEGTAAESEAEAEPESDNNQPTD